MNTSGSTNKVAVAPCPFCGCADTACGIADEEFGRFWVECTCGARGPTVETLKDARPAWNKRLAPEPVDDEQWQRSMEDAVRFRFFFDPHRGETSKAILGLTMKALTPPYPSVDAWRAAIDADRLGLTKAASAVEPSAGQPPAFYRLNRKGDAYDSAFYPADEWDLVLVPNALTKEAK